MEHQRADRGGMREALAPHADVVVAVEETGMHGIVVVERFTPPSVAELDEMVYGLRPAQVIDGLYDLDLPRAHVEDLRVGPSAERARRRLALALAVSPDYLVQRIVVPNLITQVGDQYYGERASGIGSPPNQVVGMKLGTGTTAVAKTGAGAALVTYLSASHKAIDGGYPTSGLSSSSRRITWKSSWPAGDADGAALREVVIVNEGSLTDATTAAANTIARALFGPMTLGSLDTLSVTWSHDLLGA